MAIEIAPRIEVDAAVANGKPVIQGTAVAVGDVVAKLASGLEKAEVAAACGITLDDLHAALAYAASTAGRRVRRPTDASPAEPKPKRKRKTGILTKDDPLFSLIGKFSSDVPGGMSGDKHRYLAEAYEPKS